MTALGDPGLRKSCGADCCRAWHGLGSDMSLQDCVSDDGGKGDDRLSGDEDGALLSTLNVLGMARGWYRTGDCGGLGVGLEEEAWRYCCDSR